MKTKKLCHTLWLFFSIFIMFPLHASSKNTSTQFIVKEGKIPVPGGQVWYQIISTEKTNDNIPLLILHGGPGMPHDYLNILKSLANERPIIFYDQLGVGYSQIAKNSDNLWQLDRFERELEAVINTLHLKKVHLFGHSWGGALALQYALENPDTLNSLILASPLISTSQWISDAKIFLSQLSPAVQKVIMTHEQQRTTDSPEYLKAVDIYYHHFIFRLKVWPEDLVYSMNHLNFNVYKTMWGLSEFSVTGNLKNFDRMNALKQLSMPVLITGGKYDEAGPETLAYAVKQIPQGKLIIYVHSAHMAFLEEKEAYLHNLRLFLIKHDRRTQ